MGIVIGIFIFFLILLFCKIGSKDSTINDLRNEIKQLNVNKHMLEQSSLKLLEMLRPITKEPQVFLDRLYNKCLDELNAENYSFLKAKEEHIRLWEELQAPKLPKTFVDYVHKYNSIHHQEQAIKEIDAYLLENPEKKYKEPNSYTRKDEFVIQEFNTIYEIYFNFYRRLLEMYQKNYDLSAENAKQAKSIAKSQAKLDLQKSNNEIELQHKKSLLDEKIDVEKAKLSKQREELEQECIFKRQELKKKLEMEKSKQEQEFLSRAQELKEYETKIYEIIDEKYAKLEQDKQALLNTLKQKLKETGETYGELSAETATEYLDRFAQYFKDKKHSATTSSQIVADLKREQKAKIKDLCKYEYIIDAYEKMFPWLSDFKEYPMEAVLKANADDQEEDEVFTHYLSPEERESLTKTEKFQRVLDRYEDSYDKTNWQIGLFYERYIGYTYDIKQWKVIMNGAKKRWQDMGIDIIASKDGKTELIQCKYWAANKTIYEKYIFQLFGTTIDYIMENFSQDDPWTILNNGIVTPVFVTSTQVSDTARRVAKMLKIDLRENVKLDKKYPKIKCNPDSPDGKIFHLPFDQQYDNFQLGNNPHAFYAKTVVEAEKLGFRRAYRWHPTE